MGTQEINTSKRIESKIEVETYLDRMNYAIKNGSPEFSFQQTRKVDNQRNERFTNRFTIGDLFPDDDPIVAIKRELLTLTSGNYIETLKDTKFINRSEMRVFGKYYSNYVYIKIRVELLHASKAGVGNHIFIMSFHYAEHAFSSEDFPYARK